MNKKLLIPDIGDFESVEVIEILVKQGDKISINDPVITIESDKSSVEVPSVFKGTIDDKNKRDDQDCCLVSNWITDNFIYFLSQCISLLDQYLTKA